jgi:hypothetical protein
MVGFFVSFFSMEEVAASILLSVIMFLPITIMGLLEIRNVSTREVSILTMTIGLTASIFYVMFVLVSVGLSTESPGDEFFTITSLVFFIFFSFIITLIFCGLRWLIQRRFSVWAPSLFISSWLLMFIFGLNTMMDSSDHETVFGFVSVVKLTFFVFVSATLMVSPLLNVRRMRDMGVIVGAILLVSFLFNYISPMLPE